MIQRRNAPSLRLSSPFVRRLLGGGASIAVGLAAYIVFGPLSDQRAWQLAGVHDASISGAARQAIRRGALPGDGDEFRLGAAKAATGGPTGSRRGADLADGAS